MKSLETIREQNAEAVRSGRINHSPATPEPRVWLGNPDGFVAGLPNIDASAFKSVGWVRAVSAITYIRADYNGSFDAIFTPGKAYAVLYRAEARDGTEVIAVVEFERAASRRIAA